MRINSLKKHDRIKVTTSNFPDNPIVGQYRGRIVSENNYSFDKKGRAIWITADQGFELMLSIDLITNLETIN